MHFICNMNSNNETGDENIKILPYFCSRTIGIPIKLASNIYAYEEESNKRDNYLLSQTLIHSSSISRGVLTDYKALRL